MRQRGLIEDVLLLLEHPLVITSGKRTDPSMLRIPPGEMEKRGAVYREVERGGYPTVHAPGQLVGYSIRFVDDLKAHIIGLEETIYKTAISYAKTNVIKYRGLWYWRDGKYYKFGARGVYVSGGAVPVSMHGFDLDVSNELTAYDWIDACGFRKEGTPAERLGKKPDALALEIASKFGGATSLSIITDDEIEMDGVKARAAESYAKVFGVETQTISAKELIRLSSAGSDPPDAL